MEDHQGVKKHFADNLDLIINATGIGMWDWDLKRGTIVHSGQLERIAGYEVGEMPDGDIIARDRLIYPADRHRADEIIRSCVEGRIDNYETEFRIVCKDGGIKWIQDRGAVAERGEDGQALRIVGMFYDVSRFKKREESLVEKVQLLDYAVGLSGIGTAVWDLTDNTLFFDEDFLKMFGYKESEVARTYMDLHRYIHTDDMAELGKALHEYIERGSEDGLSKQLRARHKNGQWIWVLLSCRIVEWSSDNRPKRIIASLLNVDRLVRAELEAQTALIENRLKSEQLERDIENAERDLAQVRRTSVAMFEATPYMSVLYDENYEAVDCNPIVMEFFEYDDKQALLRDLPRIIAERLSRKQPNGQAIEGLHERLRKTMETGYTEFEILFIHRGTPVPMNVIMKRIVYRDRFAVVAYQIDMTSTKRAERALLHQDRLLKAANRVALQLMETDHGRFYEAMMRSLKILGRCLHVQRAYIWKNEGRGSDFRARELLEWRDESAERIIEDGHTVVYEEVFADFFTYYQESGYLNGPVREMDDRIRSLKGLVDVKSLLCLPIMLQGEFWGFLGFDDLVDEERHFTDNEVAIMRSSGMLMSAAVMRDEMMRNLIEAKEAALEASRAKGDFLSRMSHEIRTPMNAIIGMASIARQTTEPDRFAYCMDHIDAASRQLLSLINDILDMSKIEANKLEIHENSFVLEGLIRNVYQVIIEKMREKQLHFTIDFRRAFDKMVLMDELRLSQVLLNLLNNACKFTPEFGHIELVIDGIMAADGQERLRVMVADDGIGMSAEQVGKLFNAFEQADGTITRKYGGTGLGLAISKNIVRLMGGDIWVQSEPGKGSVFTFEVRLKWGSGVFQNAPKWNEMEPKRLLIAGGTKEERARYRRALSITPCLIDEVEALGDVKTDGTRYDIAILDDGLFLGGAPDLSKIIEGGTEIVVLRDEDPSEADRDDTGIAQRRVLQKPIFPTMLLGLLLGETDSPKAARREDPEDHDWSGRRILLAEDIEINREIVLSLLEPTRAVIDWAKDGGEAVRRFENGERRYDLILMDVQMPVMDGMEATRRIRAAKDGARVPIVAMTANAFKEDIDRCIEAGMNDHVAKPVDIDELIRTLSKYFG